MYPSNILSMYVMHLPIYINDFIFLSTCPKSYNIPLILPLSVSVNECMPLYYQSFSLHDFSERDYMQLLKISRDENKIKTDYE